MANFDLTNRIAVVNGASRGIGEAIARGFAEQGATVVITSRRQESLDKVAASIRESGGKAVPIACHGGKPAEMKSLFTRVEQELGGLDILVNNAANNPYFGPAIDAPESTIDKTIEVNLKGFFLMIQFAARLMKKRGGGSIINISSIAGIKPSIHEVAYSMTKAGIINLTKGFAKELGPDGIRVNAIAPGLIETGFSAALVDTEEKRASFLNRYPVRRLGQPNDVAAAAIYLASDAASFTSGSVMIIDGGAMA
ncbi:MAG: glucose 1-dehydrogenase [Deltaproteobacteria bacterium]|nr:glucose 1-dehydrogenase [Deltaproteobacteria bacterium]